MKKISVISWDKSFFLNFIELRTQIYRNHPDFISETIEDLDLFFGANSFFASAVNWKAVLVKHDEKIIGRYLLSMNAKSEDLYLGFFECIEQEDVFKAVLFADIKEFKSRYPQIKNIKGPIQGSLFGGYRFREPTAQARFLGESLHLDSYPELWKKWGFSIEEYWDSFEVSVSGALSFYSAVKTRFQKFWDDPKIVCRPLQLARWNQELKDIFAITLEAYDITGTNDEVDEKIFATLSEKIKPLLSPQTVKILQHDGKTVGFNICYLDIQDEIRRFNGRKKYLPLLLNKIILIAAIKLKKHPLLLVYVAKSKDCPVKWAMANLACSMIADVSESKYSKVISVLNAESAGSRASLPEDKKLHSRHFLMQLSAENI
jgi:hypothetical protein